MRAFTKRPAVAAVALFGVSLAFAHGEHVAQRGGILKVVEELDFELVVKADRIELYTLDDRVPVPSEQMSGTLTIVRSADKTKVALAPAGINRLRASDVTAASGSRVIAIVKLPDGKSLAVEFAVP